MVNAYDTLSDGQSWTHTLQNEVGTALGAVDSVGFRPYKHARYIIYKEDSTYYRVDGTDGEVDGSSANAATLINNAISDAGTGLVFLRDATYSLGTTALDNIAGLCGESMTGTILSFTGAGQAILVNDNNDFYIGHLTIGGDGTAASKAVNIQKRSGLLENLYLKNVAYGIYGTEACWGNTFLNVTAFEDIGGAGSYGFFLENGVTYNPNCNNFVGGRYRRGKMEASTQQTFTNTWIDGTVTPLLTLDGTKDVCCNGLYVETSTATVYGVSLDSDARMYGWGYIETSTANYEITSTAGCKYWFLNRGTLWTTLEASGASTGTGATQNIAHGMGLTPERIGLAQTSVGTGYPVQTSGANATYIFVSAGSGVTYDWRAWMAEH